MHLTAAERERILDEVESIDYGRVIVEVCGPRGRVDVTVERRVRIREKPQVHALPAGADNR